MWWNVEVYLLPAFLYKGDRIFRYLYYFVFVAPCALRDEALDRFNSYFYQQNFDSTFCWRTKFHGDRINGSKIRQTDLRIRRIVKVDLEFVARYTCSIKLYFYSFGLTKIRFRWTKFKIICKTIRSGLNVNSKLWKTVLTICVSLVFIRCCHKFGVSAEHGYSSLTQFSAFSLWGLV